MTTQRVITRQDFGFIGKDSLADTYLVLENYTVPVTTTVLFKEVNARQQVWSLFYEGEGIELINRDIGTSHYSLTTYKPTSTDPVRNPSINNVIFRVLKDGAALVESLTIDVGVHQWLGVRFSTRDTAVKDSIFLMAEFKTDRMQHWQQLCAFEDQDEAMWGQRSNWSWKYTSTPPHKPSIGVDDYVVQRFGNTGKNLPYGLSSYRFVFDGGTVTRVRFDSEEVLTLPLVDTFETQAWAVTDVTKPTVSITADPGPSITAVTDASFSYVGTDAYDIIGYEYKINDSLFTFTESTSVTIPHEHLIVGDNTFVVRSIDDSNNSSDEDSFTFTVTAITDVIPPTTTILTGPTNNSYTFLTDATFTWTGADNIAVSHYEYKIDGGLWTTTLLTTLTLNSLSYGAHTFQVRSVDTSLNVDTTPEIRTWVAHDFSQVPNLVHWLDFTDSSTINGGSVSYTHTQGVAAVVWNINHALNTFPSIVTVDGTGAEIFGDLVYVDSNNVQVTFSVAQAGFAYINTGLTTHSQALPQSTWIINHNLGLWPHVTTVDLVGSQIFGSVRYVSANTVQVDFSSGEMGFAYLNSDSMYIHVQGAPSTTWTINHGLYEYPSVTTVDSLGNVVVGDVTYVSNTTVTVDFGSNQVGYAYLNSSQVQNNSDIVSVIDKSSLARVFTQKLGFNPPTYTNNISAFPPITVGGAVFDANDVLSDTVANPFISGNSLTLCAILANDGDAAGVLAAIGVSGSFNFGSLSDVTESSFIFTTSNAPLDDSTLAVPEEPFRVVDEPVLLVVRFTGGRGQVFINGQYLGEQELNEAWTLGAFSSAVEVGNATTDVKVLHTVVYDRYLTQTEIEILASTYSVLCSSLTTVLEDRFNGVAATTLATHTADSGQTWTQVVGNQELDGSGAVETLIDPSTATVTLTPVADFVLLLEGVSILGNDDDTYLVFRALTASPAADYYRVQVENTFGGTQLVRLQQVIATVLQPDIATLSLPWIQTIDDSGKFNISIGVRGTSIAFGAGLSVSPVNQADGATPWTGEAGNSRYIVSTLPAYVVGEDDVGFELGFVGVKCDRIRLLEKV